ncbi:MAG: sensor histidine kinase [Dehalococcoidia bacterium]
MTAIVGTRLRFGHQTAAVAVLVLTLGLLASAFVFDPPTSADGLWVVPIVSSATVGAALAVRRPRHPAGWLFLLLALAIVITGGLDSYAVKSAEDGGKTLPATNLAAVFADSLWMPWIMVLALILLFTPDGSVGSKRRKAAFWTVVGSGSLALFLRLLRPYDGPLEANPPITNPLAIERFEALVRTSSLGAIVVLHIVLLVIVAAMVQRFRSSRGRIRRQLRWMALAAIPFPVLIVGAFIAAVAGNETILAMMAGGFVSVLPLAAAFAIEQDQLYDVDRLVSRGLTYATLTAVVIGCYAAVVVFAGQVLGDALGGSQAPAVVATLCAVSVAIPLRRVIQDALDRRFNRRKFEAVTMVQRFVREPAAATPVQTVLQTATGDPALRVTYWLGDRDLWVTQRGEPAETVAPFYELMRDGQPVARITFDDERVDRSIVAAVAAEARPELENERLRAAITLQLAEVRESRARIVEAQLSERQKIERNLHDGAQQRLLALALDLRAAELSGETTRVNDAVHHAVDELQVAVRELRELANGLNPSVLTDGGLSAALEMLATTNPASVQVQVEPRRYPAAIEAAAWFIACESVANAIKHARATRIEVEAVANGDHLRLVVRDDGVGGAMLTGRGLRGIADRAEAVGGHLLLESRPGATVVSVELPCGS